VFFFFPSESTRFDICYFVMNSIIASFFSSFVSTVHADASDVDAPSDQEQQPTEPAVVAVAEEEPEPEDLHPSIREDCKASAKCAALTKHFEHCQEKVLSGQGFKGEDCVEELFHMMHCVDAAAAPKVFAQLR